MAGTRKPFNFIPPSKEWLLRMAKVEEEHGGFIGCGDTPYNRMVVAIGEAQRSEKVSKPKIVDVPSLDDYRGTLDDLISKLEDLRRLHGGSAHIEVDAGHNNVQFTVTIGESK
jgi:hypothetical protein